MPTSTRLVAPAYAAEVSSAFPSGRAVACCVVAGVALVGGAVAWRFLPAGAPERSVDLTEPITEREQPRAIAVGSLCGEELGC